MSGLVNVPPHVVFGAGEQADHVLLLLDWMGLPTNEIVLFDDGFPDKQVCWSGLPVIGTIEDGVGYCSRISAVAMIAIGSKGAAFRYALYKRLTAANVGLSSIVAPSALVAPTAIVGPNVLIMPGVYLGKNAVVEALGSVFSNATIEHDTVVEENAFCGPGVTASGHVTVGKHAFIGVGATVCPHVRIGRRSLVGAGAVVVRDLPADVIAVGVPAQSRGTTRPGMDVPTRADLEKSGCESDDE